MCSKARCSGAAIACASTFSSSTPRQAITCGPSVSTSPWPISSTCRTKSSRAWRGSCDAELVAAEARRAERAPDPDAMDLYFQGTACWHRGQSLEILSQARGYFERALARDRSNIEALLGAAWMDALRGTLFMGDDRAQRLGAAEAAATRTLSLAPDHAFAHLVLGYVQIFTNRATQGIAEAERALALDRNLANAHAFIGAGKTFAGRAE